ncbi:MAG TPA: LysM peptidoglycan-binding domain-containing protein [Mycobacteriales bacterium]|jgi:LysM repeat protein|nr:LysM peptidoglycan-binding domain-containing protein [Mycobacteriales bacterium]
MPRLPKLLIAAAALIALATAAAPGWSPYVVQAGDTLWGLARTHHTSVTQLQRSNGLSGDLIYVGQRLDVPGNGVPATADAGSGGASSKGRAYTVRAGDTLTGVAQAAGTDLGAIARLNHLTGDLTIYIGQKLRLPAAPEGVFAAAPSSPQYAPAISASARTLATRSDPGSSRIRQMIAAEAGRQGVDPSLALAVADQESGFSQRMVSGTDAVGVMQLEPYTSSWLAAYTGTTLDRYNVADNIRGGVTLLRLLSAQASVSDTIASYYQGLASVRARGMFSDTRSYVQSVTALQRQFR